MDAEQTRCESLRDDVLVRNTVREMKDLSPSEVLNIAQAEIEKGNFEEGDFVLKVYNWGRDNNNFLTEKQRKCMIVALAEVLTFAS